MQFLISDEALPTVHIFIGKALHGVQIGGPSVSALHAWYENLTTRREAKCPGSDQLFLLFSIASKGSPEIIGTIALLNDQNLHKLQAYLLSCTKSCGRQTEGTRCISVCLCSFLPFPQSLAQTSSWDDVAPSQSLSFSTVPAGVGARAIQREGTQKGTMKGVVQTCQGRRAGAHEAAPRRLFPFHETRNAVLPIQLLCTCQF